MVTSSNYHKHITILSVLYIGMGLVSLAIAIGLFLLLWGIGIAVDDPVALQVLGTISTISACFLTVTAIPSLIAGFGLLARRAWARILALILAIFKLFNIPIGTAVGVYAFWVLLQDDAQTFFSAGHKDKSASNTIVEV